MREYVVWAKRPAGAETAKPRVRIVLAAAVGPVLLEHGTAVRALLSG